MPTRSPCFGAFVATALVSGLLGGCGDYVVGPPPEAADPLDLPANVYDEDAGAPTPENRAERSIDAGRNGDGGADAAPPVVVPAWEMPPTGVPATTGRGRVLFLHPDGMFRRVEAVQGGVVENVGAALNRLSPGVDSRMTQSKDGALIVGETTRFGCSTPCLAVFGADLASGGRVTRGGEPIRIGATPPVIAAGGRLIVFASAGAHSLDLYSITRPADPTLGWSKARLLTATSPMAWNHRPSLSTDQTKVVFDCGADADGTEATSVCEVGVDGAGFRVVARPAAPLTNLHNPSYDADGSIVFEGEGATVINGVTGKGERIHRVAAQTPAPTPLAPTYTNDNTPCVLPSGNVVSLWLGRQGNAQGGHELKLMSNKGQFLGMIAQGFDIRDVGLSCGN